MSRIQIARALRLMTLLRAKTARRPKGLAVELEVSERTVYRDLSVLATVGMCVRFDAESGGYQIGGDFFLPPVQLTVAEALALSVLGSQIARQVPCAGSVWELLGPAAGRKYPTCFVLAPQRLFRLSRFVATPRIWGISRPPQTR